MKKRYFFQNAGKLTALLLVIILAISGIACGDSGNTTPCAVHKDEDNNGKCDKCKVSVIVNIDVYAVNDLHGRFSSEDGKNGVDTMTTFFKMQEMSDPNNIILSSGDTWQGSSESNNTKGALLTEWMQKVGFVSMTLGNHEFDWGTEKIKENAETFQLPFLAINVYSKDTDKLVDYCTPSIMVERAGVKVGIIGAIGDCYSSIQTDKTEGIYFKVGNALTELVKAESDRLRTAGADIIIYSIHDGYDKNTGSSVGTITENNLSSYYDVSLSNGYVDAVFEAHTHKEYILKDKYGVYHMQAGGENSVGLSHVDINFNIANRKMSIDGEIVNKSTYASYADDAIVAELMDKYKDQIGDVNAAVGYTDHNIDSEGIANLVAMLYYKKGCEVWADKYDITLAGGYINARKPYNIYKGDVTYADVQSVLPFDNEICLCSVNGISLNNNFFENEKYVVYYEDYGEVIKGGINPNGTYYVVVDSYTATYKPNNLTIVEKLPGDIFARDLVIEYLKKNKKS